jgi:TRAP-type C4-dicarboxylate transport system permease small subunit
VATRALARAKGTLHRAEDALLALLLGATVLLASLQILLRGVFDVGIGWIDPLVRVLVLWLGLLGALAASRGAGRQITIDVVSRLLPERQRAAVGTLTSSVTAVISGVLAYHAGRLVISEFEFGSVAFSGIPAWQLASVLPFAFGAIALRYVVRAIEELHTAVTQQDETP